MLHVSLLDIYNLPSTSTIKIFQVWLQNLILTGSFTVVQTWYKDNGTYEDQEPDRRRGEQVKARIVTISSLHHGTKHPASQRCR